MHDVLRIGGQYSETDMKAAVEVKFLVFICSSLVSDRFYMFEIF